MVESWEINRRILMLDSHVDIPLNFATEEIDPGVRTDRLQVDLVKMGEGGLDGVFLAAFNPQGPLTEEGYLDARETARTRIEAVHRLCNEMHPGRIELVRSAADAGRAVKKGKKFAAIGLENGYPLGKDLSLISRYYDLGVRYITLCHNGHNQICDSCNPADRLRPAEGSLDNYGNLILRILNQPENDESRAVEPLHHGLSEFGRQVVAEMNRLGIMVDVSHLSPDSLRDVLEISQAPVIASHSSCRALCGRNRNLDDKQLTAIKRNGGCVQIAAVWGFLNLPGEQMKAVDILFRQLGLWEIDRDYLVKMYRENRSAYTELIKKFSAGWKQILERFPLPDVADLVDHIDHAAGLMGIDHAGIGSDFGGGGGVRGYNSASEAANVTVELLRRGYSEDDIAKIWGGNLLRVWREVESVAGALQAEC